MNINLLKNSEFQACFAVGQLAAIVTLVSISVMPVVTHAQSANTNATSTPVATAVEGAAVRSVVDVGVGRQGETNAVGVANNLLSPGTQGSNSRVAMQGTPSQVGAGVQSQNAKLTATPAFQTLGLTQFQRFVEEATGKNLPLYGYNLFDRSRFPSLTDVPVPTNYVVGPGDEIDLKIWGAIDVALRLPVDRNGQITVPKVGPVTVTGTPSSELDAHLKKQVGRVFVNFELSASIGRLRSMQIFVVGQARNPGAYLVSSLSTLIGALFESGGPAANGTMRAVQLLRGGQVP